VLELLNKKMVAVFAFAAFVNTINISNFYVDLAKIFASVVAGVYAIIKTYIDVKEHKRKNRDYKKNP
jgi:hypothetical protein